LPDRPEGRYTDQPGKSHKEVEFLRALLVKRLGPVFPGRSEGEEPILRPGKAMAYHQTVREDARQVAGAGRAPSGRSGPVRQPIGAGCVGGMCVDF
jgi:hypothetical protein